MSLQPRVASEVLALSICPAIFQQATVNVLHVALLLDQDCVWHSFSIMCCVWYLCSSGAAAAS
jgi:hypothetical protein